MYPTMLCGSYLLACLCTYVSAFANCKEVSIEVTGTAKNFDLSAVNISDPNLASIIAADAFPTILTSGTNKLAGQYCEPLISNNNNDKLQLLVHGITSNRDYWFGQGGTGLGFPSYKPKSYSWTVYAQNLGYAVLAIDRLGNGISDHPDPISKVQGPYEIALLHALSQNIRKGTTGALPRKYSDLIYVGHSYGSELGATLIGTYPNAFNQVVLTGFSKLVQPSLPGIGLQEATPAFLVFPKRFAGLAPGYVTALSKQGHTNSFFGTRPGIDYDIKNADLFYNREDTVSVGQFISTYVGNQPSPEYKGRLLVLTGEEDQAFCGPGSPVLGPAMCGSLLKDTGMLFPSAEYNWKSVPNTGHVVNLHYTSQSSFKAAHAFMAGKKFSG